MRDGSTLAHTQWRLGITIAQIARRWRARLDQRIAEYGLTEARWLALLAGGRGAAGGSQPGRRPWLAALGAPALSFLAVVLVHMLLSGELARMGYLAAPVFAVALALIIGQRGWLREETAAAAAALPSSASAPA